MHGKSLRIQVEDAFAIMMPDASGISDEADECGSFSRRDESGDAVGRTGRVVEPHYQPAGTGAVADAGELVLWLHCLQLWYSLSDSSLADAVHGCRFSASSGSICSTKGCPARLTMLKFRRLLESHRLSEHIFAKVKRRLGRTRPADEGGHGGGRDDPLCAEQHQESRW